MIVVLKENLEQQQVDNLITWLKGMDLSVHVADGFRQTVLGLVGDTSKIDIDLIRALDIVASVQRVTEPYKSANRKFHPQDTVVACGNAKIGGGHFSIIAGPCSIETDEQIEFVACAVKEAGAHILRGGAFKPRTSPYSFQGLGKSGLDMLIRAKKATGLPVVTEIMDLSQLPLFDDVDMIQIGARNMQNFELLKEVGRLNKPVLLKRGMSSTLEELLMSAEYIMAGGNEQVVLCERGIRSFETYTRNTLDISAVPILKKLSHLPVVVDPSHAIGISEFVAPAALAATAIGADGLMIEVHNDPPHALSDGKQSLTPEAFKDLVQKVNAVRPFAFKREGDL